METDEPKHEQSLTVKQVATRLNCKPGLVRDLILSRRLRAVNLSSPGKRKSYRIEPAWVDEFLATGLPPVQVLVKPEKLAGIKPSRHFP